MIRTIITALFLVVFFLISLPLYGVIALVSKVSQRKADDIAQGAVKWALRVIQKIAGVDLVVNGFENIPGETTLFIGNHTSFFDIVVTYPLLPHVTGYVAKKEIDKVPLLKWWMPCLHGLTFERDNPRSGMKMIMSCIDNLKQGYSMFIFPEGTRAKEGEMLDFKAGSFKPATRTGVPIMPVAITGTADIFEKHMPFIRSSKVVVSFGEPVYPASLTPEEKKHIARYVQDKVEAML